MWRLLVAAALFYAFVPGVLVTLPSKSSSKNVVMLVHAVLFAVVLHYVMKHCRYEYYGNHGPSGCPPGTHPGVSHTGEEACLPSSGTRQHPPGSSPA
jgi:hypothetical protein